MPDRESVHYFGAGPAPLPTEVLTRAGSVMLNYNNLGVGVCEMSHRSADANKVLADTKSALADVLDIPLDKYDILFSQGGGSGQFSAVVYHCVAVWVARQKAAIERVESDPEVVIAKIRERIESKLRLDYIVTGSWSLKASQEAGRLLGPGHVNVAADARRKTGKFGGIPAESEWSLSPPADSAMVYYCDNETVDGVEFPSMPACLRRAPDADRDGPDSVPVVCDMSSNYISRPVAVQDYDLIFGGAQKNIGVTGVTIIIVRKALVAAGAAATPELLRAVGLPVAPVTYDLTTMAKNNSLYNTLPIFDVWIAGQVIQNLAATLGPDRMVAQEKIVAKKAGTVYAVLEKYSDVYQIVPEAAARSRMNICFRILADDVPAAEKQFISGAEELGLLGLKGHRSVGGMRISNYNAVSIEAIDKLARYLDDFAGGLTG